MNPPSLWTWLVGNAVSFIAVCMGFLFVGYLFLTTGQYGFQLLVLSGISWHSYRANDRVRAFQAWQREWKAMNGETPTRLTLPRLGPLRILGGIAVWLLGAWFALEEANTPGLQIPLGMFWLGSILMVGYGLYRLVVRLRGARSRSDGAARVALSRPFQSPALQDAYSALPEYCWPLFQRSA
ncbi:MAG: hypothetical protein Q8L23_01010 [Caulobacter sp.]|nr:hypothetical protein [Caulobacter sp.]